MRRNRLVIKMLRKIIAASRTLVMKCSVDVEDENLGMISVHGILFPFRKQEPTNRIPTLLG